MSAPAIYAVEPTTPLTYQWRGCAAPDRHEVDSSNPDFACPYDLCQEWGKLTAGETDAAYAKRVQGEFLALLALRAPAAEPAVPPALANLTVVVTPAVDHATTAEVDPAAAATA